MRYGRELQNVPIIPQQFLNEVAENYTMPKAVQLQLFNRSFSTKGAGRGLGTYSIRLFGEKYLGGKATFRSNNKEGTTFSILLPAS